MVRTSNKKETSLSGSSGESSYYFYFYLSVFRTINTSVITLYIYVVSSTFSIMSVAQPLILNLSHLNPPPSTLPLSLSHTLPPPVSLIPYPFPFRDADPEFGFIQSKELEQHLKEIMAVYDVEVCPSVRHTNSMFFFVFFSVCRGHGS